MPTHPTKSPGSRRLLWSGGWFAAAVWAGVFALVAGPAPHRVWGACAAVGYLCAAGSALRPRGCGRAAVGLALAGAVAVPLLVLLVGGGAQSEVGVIERSGVLTLRQAHPYLTAPGTVAEVTPYLPGMAVFGLPGAVLGDGAWPHRLLGDARLWCATAFLGCVWAALRAAHGGRAPGGAGRPVGGAAGRPVGGAGRRFAVGAFVASPVVALPLCVSGVDLPLTGLLFLALVYAARRRPVAAGLALAAACSLKWTAWPAVAVAVALLAHRGGAGAAVRAGAVAVGGTVAAVLPSAVLAPGPLVAQVFAFPTGRGPWETPAASPLPGRLLADLGPGGWYAAVALLAAGGLAVAASLFVRPPSGLVPAADRLAAGLCAAFLLAPAGRFGYLALPVALAVLARVAADPGTAGPTHGTGVPTPPRPRTAPSPVCRTP
ncbi:glycosyltransferase 87 family protein [Streptomyces fradiae]|uniref:glycosyltransferase 87 family protein n=1 Tax=Streptomyces fradiae TaxID=1906 RepID=UPI002942773A|nr:glycosyltransferase 87 family protein [Streptomyces fradiae]WOI61879.1 glycosyltransferase 87 family protein [Streptomyces fradiae]